MRSALWLAGGLLLGTAIYNHLEGADLVRDLGELWRLRPLDELDREWRHAPRSELTVCVTTLPSRLPHLHWTLRSLLAQRPAPRRVRLHLPSYSERERRAYLLPEGLASLESVELVECPDRGPATKLLPALGLPERTPLVVVDDDRIYPPGFLQHLEGHRHAVGLSGWRVPKDLTDRPTTLWSNLMLRPPTPVKCSRIRHPYQVDVLQGLAGYRVEPRFFGEIPEGPPEARTVDDVWLSGHCRAPKWVYPFRRFPYQHPGLAPHYRATSLGRLNAGPPETRNNTVVLRYLRDRWLLSTEPGSRSRAPGPARPG